MRLYEVDTKAPGTYAAVKFDQDTINQLVDYQYGTNLSNPTKPENFHSTMAYSKIHLPDYHAEGDINPAWQGQPTYFDIFSPEDDRVLVLCFHCQEMSDKFNDTMKTTNATWDYPGFIPHISLAYNMPEDFDPKSLPPYEGPINIAHEYSEDLENNWSDSQ